MKKEEEKPVTTTTENTTTCSEQTQKGFQLFINHILSPKK